MDFRLLNTEKTMSAPQPSAPPPSYMETYWQSRAELAEDRLAEAIRLRQLAERKESLQKQRAEAAEAALLQVQAQLQGLQAQVLQVTQNLGL